MQSKMFRKVLAITHKMKPPLTTVESPWLHGSISKDHRSAQKHRLLALTVIVLIVTVCSLTFDWSQIRVDLTQNGRLEALARNYNSLTTYLASHDILDFNGENNEKGQNSRKFQNAKNRSDNKSDLQKRLPQCIIIGARKCGTRALLEALNLHPDIRTARYEVHFFDSNQAYDRGLEWYRQRMPHSYQHQVTLEKTPGYFTSSLAPERVYRMNSSEKLILIVRDPVVRTISDYTQVHYTKLVKGKPHIPFEKAVFNEESGALNADYKPLRNSLYVKHLRRWLEYFPLDQIHLVDGDRFATDPLAELRKIEKFLNLAPKIHHSQIHYNEAKGFYCFRKDPELESGCLGNSKGRPHVSVDKQTKEKLRQLLVPYNQRFFNMVGRRFNW